MKVLFVCYANLGRSQMAKAFYNAFTHSQNAEGSGTGVSIEVPEAKNVREYEQFRGRKSSAVIAMNEKYIDIEDSPRIQITPRMLADYDLVVNIASKNQTPDWLRGENVIWWDIADPHVPGVGASVETATVARDAIEGRVRKLIEVENAGGNFHELDDNIDEERT